MAGEVHLFNFSEYPRNHFLYNTENKKRHRTHDIPIEEYAGLQPKIYSLLNRESNKMVEKKVAKRIVKHQTKDQTRTL